MKKRSARFVLLAGFIFVWAAAPRPVAPMRAAQTENQQAVLQKVCGTCHALDRVTASRRSRAQWEETTDKMITAGAKATDEEFTAVINYLVSRYGRVNVNTAPAGEIAEALGLSDKEADAVVKQRQDKGKFEDFEALSKTPGVAVQKLEKSRDAISF